jgi:hypothetical protein
MRLSAISLTLGGLVLGAGVLVLATRPSPEPARQPSDRPSAPAVVTALKPPERADEPTKSGKLAVLVVFDQLRGDYLTRWRDLYGEGGFRRLMDEGAWFPDCHYDYAHTVTAAGHASLSTGAPPSVHGVVGNDWYDNQARTWVASVNRPRELSLPPKDRKEVGPEQLLAPTVGDLLQEAADGRCRVVSLSLKDRSAMLMAGRHVHHLCLWQDVKSKPGPGSTLGMVKLETNYYMDAPASTQTWLRAFNTRKLKEYRDLWNAKTEWTRLHDRPLLYELNAGPDDLADEGTGVEKKQGRTFPHPLRWDDARKPADSPTNAFYSALQNSPYGNELLLDLAKEAIDREKLGRHGAADLLCISFSSNDMIGHCWGPDSQEVLDVTLRSDRVVRELLDHLDARVGKGNYTICLSADHGICPLPEAAGARGKNGGRVEPKALLEAAADALAKAYPEGATKEACFAGQEESSGRFDGWFTLNPAWLAAKKTTRAEAAQRLAQWLTSRPQVQAAYTRAEVLAEAPVDPLREQVRRSFHPDRCGDVALVLKPYVLLIKEEASFRTTHGSPHPYDTHVPLLIYGPGVKARVHPERTVPYVTAAVLAHVLGLRPPPVAAPAPPGLFSGEGS